MSLTSKEVERLAALARLELTEAEISAFTSQLGEVLDYVAKLQSLEEVETGLASDQGVELRSDEVHNWPEPHTLLKLAPEQAEGYLAVPEVFAGRN